MTGSFGITVWAEASREMHRLIVVDAKSSERATLLD